MKTTQTKGLIADAPTRAQARAIAREAFIYSFPFVEGYKTLYKQAVDKGN